MTTKAVVMTIALIGAPGALGRPSADEKPARQLAATTNAAHDEKARAHKAPPVAPPPAAPPPRAAAPLVVPAGALRARDGAAHPPAPHAGAAVEDARPRRQELLRGGARRAGSS